MELSSKGKHSKRNGWNTNSRRELSQTSSKWSAAAYLRRSLPSSHFYFAFPLVCLSQGLLWALVAKLLICFYRCYRTSKSWCSSLKVRLPSLSYIFFFYSHNNFSSCGTRVHKSKLILCLCALYGFDYRWIVLNSSVKRLTPVLQCISLTGRWNVSHNDKR